jgi:4-alpha-glucanotransferase
LSSFAGNSLLISPEFLIADDLLDSKDCDTLFPPELVEHERVIPYKKRLIKKAWMNFAVRRRDLRTAYRSFCARNAAWVEDYALFRALKARYHGASFLEWPVGLLERHPEALEKARKELWTQIDQVRFGQFLLSRQAEQLRNYAHAKGVAMVGDLPFFVAPDSCDLWAAPELFCVDARRRPRVVAGVPPDYFSAQGQLWGNPVYDWDTLRAAGFRWWIDRLRALLEHVDMIRLDHFRGFAAAWHVPAGSQTAQAGQWVPGPGAGFFHAVQKELGRLPFVAEDLGLITPDVLSLRDDFGIPGTRVLQFAFDGHPDNPYLPHNFVSNTVVYTGTHDNPPTREWYEHLPNCRRQQLWSYLKRDSGQAFEAAQGLMQLAWSSKAAVAIAPLQDLLNSGHESRMNTPGRTDGNWQWRCTEEMLSRAPFHDLLQMTESSGRAPLRCSGTAAYRLPISDAV